MQQEKQVGKAVGNIGKKVFDAVDSLDDKDKKELKDHVDAITPSKEKGQNKVNDIVKTTSKIVNSPEAKIAGKLAGDDVSDKVRQAGKIIDDISKSPLIVGDKNADDNKKKDSLV